LGQAKIGLRAGVLSVKARAKGARFGEMLADATLGAAIEGGQLDLGRGAATSQDRRGTFSATLTAAPGQPLRLAARGAIDGQPMDATVETSGLADFARADATIPVAVRLTLGDVRLDASGKVTRDGAGEGRLQISGGRLDRLGELIGWPLPAKGPYSASGNVVVSAEFVRANDLALNLARSRAAGELRVERRRTGRPLYVARLRVPALHLEDIGADQWVPRRGRNGSADAQAQQARREQAELESELDFIRAADIDATVDIEALHSAGERFASGRLRVTTDAGVLRVGLQNVEAAAGRIDAEIRVDPGAAPPRFALRASARALDYGPLMRSMDPETTMAGTLDLEADLKAQAPPSKLRSAMAGTVDAAIYPRGLHSPALELWGAGLLNSMLRQLDPDSRSAVECGVTSLVNSGVASSTAFFVDSTRVRIIGEYEVDLTTRALSGRIDPQSKDPALLTFAPTMLLGGTIDSPKLTSAPANVVTVPLRLGASVADFARGWLGARDKARDGAPGCREAFEKIRQARAGAH